MMKKRLKYENNWNHDRYYVGGKRVKDIRVVEIDGQYFDVFSSEITIPTPDMGTTYNATSTHFFITIKVGKTDLSVDLNELVENDKVYAIDYELEECPCCGNQ